MPGLGRFHFSPRLRAAEQKLLRGWIRALAEDFSDRLPKIQIMPASQIVRLGRKIVLDPSHRVDGRRRAGNGATLAVSYLRARRLVLHRRLFRQRWLGQRLFYHELCHFLWPRLGEQARRRFVSHLRRERTRNVRGELGDSATVRKDRLPRRPANHHAWRDYACESFCDTGAYALLERAGQSGRWRSVEFTLARRHRPARLAAWQRAVEGNAIQENRRGQAAHPIR